MVIILVARTANEHLFYLTKPYGRDELVAIRSKEQFLCPSCGSSLVLKIGDIKIPHFAHRSLSDCDSLSEPESPLHLQGKLLLHQFFLDKHFTVELEKYLPDIRQRADLLVSHHTAIEFQCSAIPGAEVSKRTASYIEIGIAPIWIGGIKERTSEYIQFIRIKAFQQKMLHANQNLKYLLLFNPEDRRFYYYSSLFFVSGNRWIGKVKALPIEKQSFPFAIPKRLAKEEFKSVFALFSQARKSFIKSQYYAKNRFQNPFWRLCYMLKLDVKNLPEIIGIPLYSADCITENAVIWQLKAIAAYKAEIPVKELVESGTVKLQSQESLKKAELVLENYLAFYRSYRERHINDTSLLDNLYDFYCKTL